MQNHNGTSVRVSALFDINAVTIAHLKHPLIVRVDPRIEIL